MNNLKKNNICTYFIMMSLFVGIVMIAITPPFQVPDEDSHFKKAYVMAYGDFVPEVKDGKMGFYLSRTMVNEIANKIKIIGNRDEKVSYSELILNDRSLADYGDKEFSSFSTVGSVPIAHIIPAIGMFIGRVIAKITQGGYASAVYLIYFARFANLIFYSFMVGMAIKITPVLKKTMLAVGVMPMSLCLAASMSYDCLIIACVFLASSLIFKLIFDDGYLLNNKNMIILAILAGTILLIKPNYSLVFLFLFFIPQCKFNDIKEFIKKALIFLSLVILVYFIFRIPLYLVSGTVNPTQSLAGEQLNYIISHPLAFFEATFKTLNQNMNFYIAGTVGLFGLIDTYMPSFIVYLYLLIIIIIGISDAFTTKVSISPLLRTMTVVIPFLSILLVFFAMYWTWTPNLLGVGATEVSGVQGRYFIPMMVIPFMVFQTDKFARNKYFEKISNYIDRYTLVIIQSVLAVSCIFIFLRFWV